MKVAVFSAKSHDREFLERANAERGSRHEFHFFAAHLDASNAVLAAGCTAVCVFVTDRLDAPVLEVLADQHVRLVVLRCPSVEHVELSATEWLGMTVAQVPLYSPYAVAEHAVALMLALNRKTHRAHQRVCEGNFSLEGLLGFEMHGKTVGIIGTGRVGAVAARILSAGFGCKVLACDPIENAACVQAGWLEYVALNELLRRADIVTLHCALTRRNRHLIGAGALARMKHGAMLINTGRGELLETKAVLAALKRGQLGALGLDVYEKEAALFYEDRSDTGVTDDALNRLLTLPNVLVTGHQAFFTREAMENIAGTTLASLDEFERCGTCFHTVECEQTAGVI